MRLDNLLAQEKNQPKGHETSLTQRRNLVDGCPARSLAQNIDTGLQELLFKDKSFKAMSTPTLCFINLLVSLQPIKTGNFQPSWTSFRPDIQSDKLYAVGRLDRDTTGLLLVTDNGPLGLSAPSSQYHVDKTYRVEVNGLLTPDHIQAFQKELSFR